ncbi:MAG TPA: serpin family protein [bacterium]|uniref:Serpin (Serine protease inhibitor) n=1 Tax=candidate division TA06 bacterium ADurb.Bin417 TaxID=1852828 RepID=A0A1V5ME61_UNCT6|nr:MAG: Serpin (serine protease inhibitor) [candidate division TA06 bacterium ADurb.Bin417]HNQ35000.1 serpin family protein [bacterium]HNS48252.1 serpin family protein [bacterium]
MKLATLLALAGAGLALAANAAAETDLEILNRGNTRFACELYQKLAEPARDNLFFSPNSLSTALAMAWAGARGETSRAMASTLHFDLPPERLHAAYRELLERLGSEKLNELNAANALWAQRGLGFLPEYLNLARNSYRAGLEELDFRKAPEPARKSINAWVERQTRDRIKDLIPPGVINSQTRLVLTNAIYFKGTWAEKFLEKNTLEAPFQPEAGPPVKARLMNRQGEFGYFETPELQGLEIPYAGERLSMVILLPREADGLKNLEKRLNAENLSGWLGQMRNREVKAALPRFRLTGEFALAGVLAGMGLGPAFSDRADFSGITGRPDLCISEVVHKSFVEVNEAGTEAAAATGVVMRVTSIRPPRAVPVFRADHPFIFLIRERATGALLFLGRLANPA